MNKIQKHIFLIVLSMCMITHGKAQQDPMYSMYMFDKMLINPAFCGSSNWAVGTVKYRQQFLGLTGRPTTQTINFHSPIQAKHIGLGGKVISDKIAIMSNLAVAGTFSYHLNFAGGKLSLGIEAGMMNKKIDFTDLVVTTLGDKALNDAGGFQSSTVPDLSAGFYYQKKQLYVGVSDYHLIKKKFDYKTPTSQSHLYNQLNVIVGNVFNLSKSISYEPSMLLKYQSSVMQIDINNMVYYKDIVGLGLQYRTQDAVVAVLKCNITEGLRIAYSYDVTISKFSKYSKGAHEIMISYGIKLPPPPTQKEMHPRYYF